MGRRGHTGSGGAVVSSLSSNSGGTVKKKQGGKGGKGGASGSGVAGVEIVFDQSASRRKPRHADAGGSADLDAELARELAPAPKSAGWLGKTPVIFLREWCTKNDRKRPLYVGQIMCARAIVSLSVRHLLGAVSNLKGGYLLYFDLPC